MNKYITRLCMWKDSYLRIENVGFTRELSSPQCDRGTYHCLIKPEEDYLVRVLLTLRVAKH